MITATTPHFSFNEKPKNPTSSPAKKTFAGLLGFVLLILCSSVSFGQTTYTWNVASGAWTTAGSWTPSRTTPATDDILVFNGSTVATATVTAVANQTIGRLRIINNATVNFTSSTIVLGAGTLARTGTAVTGIGTSFNTLFSVGDYIYTGSNSNLTQVTAIGSATTLTTLESGTIAVSTPYSKAATITITGNQPGLDIASGSSLNVSATTPTVLNLPAAATGSISGNVTFTGSAHVLQAAAASGITFNSPSVFTVGAGFAGNPFGSAGQNNSVGFATGSTYQQNTTTGSNPFAKNAPSSMVVFNSGSLYRVLANVGISVSGRTYANIEINAGTYSQSNIGGLAFVCDSIKMIAGTWNLNLTTVGVTIKGNINVATGTTLGFNSALLSRVFLAGTSAQSIWGAGTVSVAATDSIYINNTSGVTVNGARTVSGVIMVSSGTTLGITGGSLTTNGNVNVNNGSLQINAGGGLVNAIAPFYGSASTLVYNTGSTFERGAEWNATGAGTIGVTAGYPNNVTIQGGTTLDLNNGSADRAMAGNLAIGVAASNGALTMNSMTNKLTVAGNATIGVASGGTGALTLGGAGGNIEVGGNWALNATGTFTHNSRRVTLNAGTTPATITGTNTFFDLDINKGSSNVGRFGTNTTTTIANNLTVSSGNLQGHPSASGTANINVTGDMSIAAGSSFVQGTSSGNYILNLSGNLDCSAGGTIAATGTPSNTINFLGSSKTINMGAGVHDFNKCNVSFGGSSSYSLVSGFTFSTGLNAANRSFTITSGGALNLNGQTLTLDNASGITLGGTLTTSGVNSTVNFNGLAVQTVASASYYNLQLSNTAGFSMAGNASVSNILTFNNGIITTGTNTLSLGSAATISGAGAGKYVNGNFQRAANTSPVAYPLGDATNYTPATITANSSIGSITVASKKGVATNLTGGSAAYATLTLSQTNRLDRFYSVSQSGFSGTYTGTFTYISTSDVTGAITAANLRSGVNTIGTTWGYPGQVTATGGAAPSLTVASASTGSFGDVIFAMQTEVNVTPTAGQSKVFGAANPIYTFSTSPDISTTGALSRVAGENVATSPYNYTIGSLASADPNYTLSLVAGQSFAITTLAITVTPNPGQSKVFGSANPTYTYTNSPSLISSDVFTGALSRDIGEAFGTYAYTLGSLTAGSNYSLNHGGSNSFAITGLGESTADFRSKTPGSFSLAATWEYDLGGNNFTNASAAPTSTNNVSIVHAVTLNQDFTVGLTKSLALGTGGTLVVNPTRTLTITGTADFGGKSVTFKSDGTGTASLGQVSPAALTGGTNVTIERYIPNNNFRSWRLLSVPTSGSQTINAAWQEGNAPLANGTPNHGTQITGPMAGGGLDAVSPVASMLSWNGASFDGIANTNVSIDNNQSYFLYIRGERTKGITGGISSSSATTLRTKGTVYTGLRTFTVPPGQQFGLIANLYPSAIDLSKIGKPFGISNFYYVWDSKIQAGNSLGKYQTIDASDFSLLPGGGSYGASNQIIESGQSFFVQNTGGVTVTINEDAKISGTNGNLGLRPSTPAAILAKLRSNLISINGNTSSIADANVVKFQDIYSNNVDGNDALKFSNGGENFGILRDTKTLIIEGRQPVSLTDTIYYRMWNMQPQAYQIQFEPTNLGGSGLTAVLEDKYLQKSTIVDLNMNNSVNFTVDANAGSSASDRFKIVFKQLAPLPVSFISITAIRSTNGTKVNWKVAAENGIARYEVERSADGRSFNKIGTVAGATQDQYTFTDVEQLAVTSFYRIKSIGLAGDVKYSSIVKLTAGNVKPGYSISPNPADGNLVNLLFKNQSAGSYQISITTVVGQRIFTSVLAHSGGSSSQVLNITRRLAAGTYQLEIIAPDKSKQTQSLVVKAND